MVQPFMERLTDENGTRQLREGRTVFAIRRTRPTANNKNVDGSGTASTRKKPSPNICTGDTLTVMECEPGEIRKAP